MSAHVNRISILGNFTKKEAQRRQDNIILTDTVLNPPEEVLNNSFKIEDMVVDDAESAFEQFITSLKCGETKLKNTTIIGRWRGGLNNQETFQIKTDDCFILAAASFVLTANCVEHQRIWSSNKIKFNLPADKALELKSLAEFNVAARG